VPIPATARLSRVGREHRNEDKGENMSGRLAGKVALVTGGGMGIGRAAALLFATEGAKVIIGDADERAAGETVALIRAESGESRCLRADITRVEEAASLVDAAVAAYGRLDCAFNNAGISVGGALTADITEEAWTRALDVNLTGTWNCLRAEIPQMLRQGAGTIVNNASAAGLVGIANSAAYAASKHGVIGLTKSAALDYAGSNIRINAICPGLTQTPLIERRFGADALARAGRMPIGRIAAPREIAEAALWLCSDAASFVTGAAVPIDGGMVAQ
jgi:NAD(P)-dependent dehydrogenase (short-subunit alcohol dehydrogenase family)